MSAEKNNFSVIVIGAGITGLSTALHLNKLKIGRVAIISDHDSNTPSLSGPGIYSGGSPDNFTRLNHAWGPEFSKDIWEFGNHGLKLLNDFCDTHAVKTLRGDRIRITSDTLEIKEMREATSLLNEAGFNCALSDPMASPLARASGDSLFVIQTEAKNGGYVDQIGLRSALVAAIGQPKTFRLKAESIISNGDGIIVNLAHGTSLTAQMIVVAAHLRIPNLVPELGPAMVSFGDQWHLAKYSEPKFPAELLGTVFSFGHGYFWGVVKSATDVIIGGGRQFRKFAGFEETEVSFNAKSMNFLLKTLAKLTGPGLAPEILSSVGFLDCRPCDEIPVIGPMFGENRIMIATGYSGAGLTLGFHAGKCLADMIATGRSSTLPLKFHPARLRSLAD